MTNKMKKIGTLFLVFVLTILVAGNFNFSSVNAVDTAENTWEAMTPMPTTRYGLGTVVVDEKFTP